MDDQGYFCLMDDNGETREDLKHTDACSQDIDGVQTMLDDAEKNGNSVIVSYCASELQKLAYIDPLQRDIGLSSSPPFFYHKGSDNPTNSRD